MLRFDAQLPPPSSLRETAPTQSLVEGGSFSQVFNEVRGEVTAFIRNGSNDMGAFSMPDGARMLLLQKQMNTSDVETTPVQPFMQSFLESVEPLAHKASSRLGVAPEIIAAQAALETGWGGHPLRHADGRDTHNFFALKASSGWRGETARVMTTEVADGVAVRQVEPFRSYESAEGAFDDFTHLLLTSPRYQKALNTGHDVRAYGEALVQGGYATDPAYADKLVAIVNKLSPRSE